MKKQLFAELVGSIQQAGKIRRGEAKPSRKFVFRPDDVRSIRQKLNKSQSEFAQMIVDQFDEMLESAKKYPLVMSVVLHPFIVGQPFRLRALRDALRHILKQRDKLWIARPGEIARYAASLPKGIVPGSESLA